MTDSVPNAIHPTTVTEWRAWLEHNHARTEGIWLITFRLATGKPRMAYDEAVETALCFGWIDSKPRTLDDERSMLWFAPRKKGSAWSRNNKERIEQLMRAGRMHAAGMAKVEAAQRDGSWSKLDAVEALEVPADLQQAFTSHPGSRAHFDAFPRSTKRAILEWIGNAKTDATRARRVVETARLAADNIRANQWSRK